MNAARAAALALAAAVAGGCAAAPASAPAGTPGAASTRGAANTRGAASTHRAAASAPATGPSLAGTLPGACGVPDAEFRARLAGELERELRWRGTELRCEGMARPDGQGLRVAFAGAAGEERLTFVFGVPRLAEGAAGTAVPVNVTVIRDGHGVYGTRGDDRCTLDAVRQTPLPAAPGGARRWRIEARGFCLEPARAVAGGSNGAILVATFDFVGLLTWVPVAPEPSPSPAPAAGPPSR